MELERTNGSITLRWPRSRIALFGLSAVGGLFVLIGTLSLITGQHFPHMTSLGTCIWAYVTGIPIFLWGLCFIGYKRTLRFQQNGIDVYNSRWRFIEWRLRYPSKKLTSLRVEPVERTLRSRLVVDVKGQAPLQVSDSLSNEDAWQLATVVSEVTLLPIRG